MQPASQNLASLRQTGGAGKQPILKRSNENVPSMQTAQKIAQIASDIAPPLLTKLIEVADDPLPFKNHENKARIRLQNMNSIYWDCGPFRELTKELIEKDNNKKTGKEHPHQNRYPNILPFEGHIWRPLHPSLPQDFYLNASAFDEGDRLYISTQGPLDNTVIDFLSAIVLSGCSVVLTLANVIEGVEKTVAWWDLCKLPMPLYGGFRIQYVDEDEFSHPEAVDGQLLIIRRFIVRDNENKEVRTVVQIHHVNWKDHGAPDLRLFGELQDRVNRLNPGKTPIVCHCSAGCGRTGTWIAADKIWRKIQAQLAQGKTLHQIDVDIEDEIIQMRKIRAQMVQSATQLKTIYIFLLWRLRQLAG
ncbi:MAG: tyrosine-protein phosphatase [Parachlamydia sp.]|nr:tyrosine-protein phosphatase [Parachlamydia sp.]